MSNSPKKFHVMDLIAKKFSEQTVARELAVRLIFAVSVTLLLVGLFSFVIQTRIDSQNLKMQLTENSNQISRLLSTPVWTFNEVEIKALINSQASIEEITAVSVIDDQGKMIAEISKVGASKNIHSIKEIFYKGKKIGKVKISGSTNLLYFRALKNLALTIFATMIVIIVIILLIIPLLEQYLDNPLNQLVRGIQNIASGQYRQKLPNVPQKELARITNEVNFMAEKISLREKEIKENMQAATVLKTELNVAETLQKSMIATRGFNTARRVAQFYQPMNNLSGDWMTVFECDNGRSIYALVGDVSGHGIPQGLVTMAAFGSIQTLRPLIQQNSKSFTPAAILNILRSSMVSILHECQLAMTVSIIKIDLEQRKVMLSSAGHPLPLVIRPIQDKMDVLTLTAKSQSPLGYEFLTTTTAPLVYRDTIHTLGPSDTICVFSDGLTEARNNVEKQFQRPFIQGLRKLERRFPPSVLLDRIMQNFQKHTAGIPASDDICLMIIDTRRDQEYEEVG